jgi:post-segregation antitoxin (ccd killing protein)
MIALFRRLPRQHRPGNVEEGAERARHVGVAVADEHGLDAAFAVRQTMDAHAALPPDRPDQALWQQGNAEPRADAAYDGFERAELEMAHADDAAPLRDADDRSSSHAAR